MRKQLSKFSGLAKFHLFHLLCSNIFLSIVACYYTCFTAPTLCHHKVKILNRTSIISTFPKQLNSKLPSVCRMLACTNLLVNLQNLVRRIGTFQISEYLFIY